MEVKDIKVGMIVEYETTLDNVIEGVVVEIISPTEILIQNMFSTCQRVVAHPKWLTPVE